MVRVGKETLKDGFLASNPQEPLITFIDKGGLFWFRFEKIAQGVEN